MDIVPWVKIQEVVLTACVAALVGFGAAWLKNSVDGSYWEAQERWKVKRDIYLRLLTALGELASVAEGRWNLQQEEMLNTHHGDGPEPPTLPEWWASHEKARHAELDRRWATAWPMFTDSQGALPLVLGPATVAALKKLAAEREKARDVFEDSDALWAAHASVLKSAKSDLRLRP